MALQKASRAQGLFSSSLCSLRYRPNSIEKVPSSGGVSKEKRTRYHAAEVPEESVGSAGKKIIKSVKKSTSFFLGGFRVSGGTSRPCAVVAPPAAGCFYQALASASSAQPRGTGTCIRRRALHKANARWVGRDDGRNVTLLAHVPGAGRRHATREALARLPHDPPLHAGSRWRGVPRQYPSLAR